MIEFEKVNSILQTLPVSYYIGRKLNVRLDYTETSYFNLMNDELVVSYPQVAKLENPTEEDVRCLLYHETSHALLTPKKLLCTNVLNIFEDERIETVCKNFYLGVNFKNFVKKLNCFDESTPVTTAMQYFYRVVRFRVGQKEFLDKVDELIKKYAYLNRSSNGYAITEYEFDIDDFYNEIEEWFNSHKEEPNNSEKDSKDNSKEDNIDNSKEDNIDNSKEDNIDNSKDNSIDTQPTQSTNTNQETSEEKDCINDSIDKEFEETMKNALKDSIASLNNEFAQLIDVNMQNQFKQLLLNKQKNSKMNGSAINSYSGTFDCRSVVRDDYKYFVRQNRAGNLKRFSKIKLNLFVDTSGSFRNSQAVVNRMLYNLALLEKQTSDFEFDVVSMSISEKLLPKNERKINANGCNMLDEKIFDIYKKVQDKNSLNINIVMFDGDAFSDCNSINDRRKYYKNFAAFNNSNCIIISNTDNEFQIDKYCKSAKKIIVDNNYAKLLIQNVMSNIQHSLK